MNCAKIQNKINDLPGDGQGKLNIQEQQHLLDCSTCRNYYNVVVESVQLLREIRQWEPILDDPEKLTRAIMGSIGELPQNPSLFTSRLKLFNRVLSAAVVALLLTLGIEQFVVLRKIHLLEARLGRVQQTYPHKNYLINKATVINIEKLFKDNPDGFKLEKLSALLRFRRVKHSDFTFYDFRRYIKKDKSFSPALTKGTD